MVGGRGDYRRAARPAYNRRPRRDEVPPLPGDPDEQGLHPRERRRAGRRRGHRIDVPAAGRRAQLHDPRRARAPQGRARSPGRPGAAGARRRRRLGGRQRRPLGERRLHLRQEAAARDRPAHPLPHPPPRRGRGRRPGGATRRRHRRPGLLRRHGDRRRRARRRTHDQHRRRRRDRHRARLRELGVADRARAAQGPRGRRGHVAHAGRRRGARSRRGPLPAAGDR